MSSKQYSQNSGIKFSHHSNLPCDIRLSEASQVKREGEVLYNNDLMKCVAGFKVLEQVDKLRVHVMEGIVPVSENLPKIQLISPSLTLQR